MYALFFIAVSSLLNYDLFTIINIQSLLGGLAAQAHAVERVPCLAVKGHLARLGVERADGGCLAVAAYQAHDDALWQFLVRSSCTTRESSAEVPLVAAKP